MTDTWNPEFYDDKHSFVWKLGSSVVELLAPQPGERILDLGCGTGQLTAQIAESGAEVVGLDNSPAMIEESAILGERLGHPWYFPSIAEFAAVLERHDLEVTQAALIDRPTPLDGEAGLRNWVRMFGDHWLSRVRSEQQGDFFARIEKIARPTLHRNSVWHADYRRLRVVACKK